MEDHGMSRFAEIAAYPSSPDDHKLSELKLSIRGNELKFYSNGKLTSKTIESGNVKSEVVNLSNMKINNEWKFHSQNVVESGELIEGLSELIIENEKTTNQIIRISNMAKTETFVISEESYIGFGTRWPSVKLDVNGGVQGTSAYSAASDRRFKENIDPINQEEALEIVSNLQGVLFDWKQNVGDRVFDDVKRNPGFIAQEVENILPQIVSTDDSGYKSVKYSSVIPYLVEAIKNLQTKVNSLKQNNNTCNCMRP